MKLGTVSTPDTFDSSAPPFRADFSFLFKNAVFRVFVSHKPAAVVFESKVVSERVKTVTAHSKRESGKQKHKANEQWFVESGQVYKRRQIKITQNREKQCRMNYENRENGQRARRNIVLSQRLINAQLVNCENRIKRYQMKIRNIE
ncbi:Hypothetical_protein [Hexamita inflata]|uniref:Hypothetical_protein n=1 Tax=Hexamita inflata TaxID=28002 RepID=A0AA86RFD9_9EUKA|nr:Hypothetical protein HINF_LOCUS60776 [Hexamita inflata]